MSVKKTETLAEYIARGGTINILPFVKAVQKEELVKNNNSGPVTIISLEEAGLFFGESSSKKRKTKKTETKNSPKLDLNSLPEALRKKFISKLKDEGVDVEEEDLEEED